MRGKRGEGAALRQGVVDQQVVAARLDRAVEARVGIAKVLESGGVADGTRTHDNRNHNPGLYQLSYSHHLKLACPTGFEPVTLSLEG